MTMRLFARQSDIEGVAEFARMSVRTLQRELLEDGSSYRQLLEEAKLERASRSVVGLPDARDANRVLARLFGFGEFLPVLQVQNREIAASLSPTAS